MRCQPLRLLRRQLPYRGEPLAKRESVTICQGLSYKERWHAVGVTERLDEEKPVGIKKNGLNFIIQADPVLIIGPHLAVGHGHMGRMLGVALERLGGLEGGVQHQVGVGRGQTVDVDVHLHEARDLTGQTLKACLDARLDVGLFGVGILVLELPENDMLDHNKNPPVVGWDALTPLL